MATLYWPFDPVTINEGFGWSEWRNGIHDGLDIKAAQGTELRATASGTVTRLELGAKDGNGIDILTDDGVKVRHWHLSRMDVNTGDRVVAGQVIGATGGAKGTWGAGNSTGAHLHWGTKVNGSWVDPQTLNPIHFSETPNPPRRSKDKKMHLAHIALPDGTARYLLFSENFYLEFVGQEAANAFAMQIGNSAPVSQSFFDKVKAEVEAGRK